MDSNSKFEEFKMLTENLSIKEFAQKFSVAERTIRRWQQKLGKYNPNLNYKPNKIDRQTALKIRELDRNGDYTQKKLAEIFGISQPMIGKIVNNLAYRSGLTGCASARIKFPT